MQPFSLNSFLSINVPKCGLYAFWLVYSCTFIDEKEFKIRANVITFEQ